MNSTTFVMFKKPTVRAKQWQLDILKEMHAEEARPSTSQRHKLAVETGLDEAWIRNWFTRKNRVSRAPVPMCMRTLKLDPPEPETAAYSDPPKSQVSSPLHPVVSQGTSNLPLASESLPASVDNVHLTQRLTPTYSPPYSVAPCSLGYTSDAPPAFVTRSSPRSSYSSFGKERALQQNTRTWRYSRDPLHNRYPDFAKFFLPVPSDTIGGAAKMPEFSSIAMSPLIHDPSSIDTAPPPDFTPSTMQLYPSIAMPVFFSASLSSLHNTQSQGVQDSPFPGH